MAQRTVNTTKWGSLGRFLTKAAVPPMMRDGWMISVLKTVMMKSEITLESISQVIGEEFSIKTKKKDYHEIKRNP